MRHRRLHECGLFASEANNLRRAFRARFGTDAKLSDADIADVCDNCYDGSDRDAEHEERLREMLARPYVVAATDCWDAAARLHPGADRPMLEVCVDDMFRALIGGQGIHDWLARPDRLGDGWFKDILQSGWVRHRQEGNLPPY